MDSGTLAIEVLSAACTVDLLTRRAIAAVSTTDSLTRVQVSFDIGIANQILLSFITRLTDPQSAAI